MVEEDRPIGGGKTDLSEFERPPEQPSAAAEATGSLEERVISKKWDVRVAAFEEITLTLRNAKNGNEDCYGEHGSQFKKYLADSHPTALEKVLGSLEAWIDKGDQRLVLSY
jgi:hypothetical protein